MGETRARVLVVDDELFFREAIRDILSAEGFEVVEAHDGEAGIELANDPSLGVAILDIRLPGVDGIEVLRRLRTLRPGLRMIMLSAHTDQELVLEALRLGATDYLAKPLHEEELLLAVQRAAEGFELAEDWGRLRGRLDRLVNQLDGLVRRVEDCADTDRNAVIADAAAQVAADVLEAAKTSVMLLDDASAELRVVSAVGHGIAAERLDPVPLGEGVAGLSCQSGEPLLVNDVDGDPRFAGRYHTGRYRSGSFMITPLSLGERRLGVLCATERAGGGPFSAEDLGLLRLLAMQVAEIVGREPRQDAPGAASKDIASDAIDGDAELARSICDAMVREVEPARIYDAALRPIAKALPAAPVSIFLIDGESGALRCEASSDAGVRAERREIDRSRGLTGAVLRSGQMVASDAPQSDPRFDAEVDTPEDGQSGPLLCVPLALRGKVVGVLRAFPRDGGHASARTGEVLGAALSAAVRNVLLYRSLLESIEEVAEARRAARR